MPSRKEIRWAQLKVGILVLVGLAILVGLIFLMSGSTGGLFARKLFLRSYFDNAAGLKAGAPVTLEGVTIGNVRQHSRGAHAQPQSGTSDDGGGSGCPSRAAHRLDHVD